MGGRVWLASSHTLRVSHTMGLPSHFLPAPNPQVLLKSIDIAIGWPTSLVGGERQGGSESRGLGGALSLLHEGLCHAPCWIGSKRGCGKGVRGGGL